MAVESPGAVEVREGACRDVVRGPFCVCITTARDWPGRGAEDPNTGPSCRDARGRRSWGGEGEVYVSAMRHNALR